MDIGLSSSSQNFFSRLVVLVVLCHNYSGVEPSRVLFSRIHFHFTDGGKNWEELLSGSSLEGSGGGCCF